MSQRNAAGAQASAWPLMLIAATIMTLTMGARQSQGLFVSPLNTSTGLGIVAISFAMAVGQFVWGASQPIFGAVADRYGPTRVVMLGAVLLAGGLAATPLVTSEVRLHKPLPWRIPVIPFLLGHTDDSGA